MNPRPYLHTPFSLSPSPLRSPRPVSPLLPIEAHSEVSRPLYVRPGCGFIIGTLQVIQDNGVQQSLRGDRLRCVEPHPFNIKLFRFLIPPLRAGAYVVLYGTSLYILL